MRTRYTHQVSTVRVHFTSIVVSAHVDLGLVDKTNDLDIIRGLHELNTLEGTTGNKTSAVLRLRAVSDSFAFSVSDDRVRVRRAPETEVCESGD